MIRLGAVTVRSEPRRLPHYTHPPKLAGVITVGGRTHPSVLRTVYPQGRGEGVGGAWSPSQETQCTITHTFTRYRRFGNANVADDNARLWTARGTPPKHGDTGRRRDSIPRPPGGDVTSDGFAER